MIINEDLKKRLDSWAAELPSRSVEYREHDLGSFMPQVKIKDYRGPGNSCGTIFNLFQGDICKYSWLEEAFKRIKKYHEEGRAIPE